MSAVLLLYGFFFFKQKTAYELRISDWSSDVCSSDLGGLLTDAVDQHPHCVLLLDEIEKAHPDLFNILLQVMDYGKMTDHNGKTVDFRNVILIMTTNAGAADMAKTALGFARDIRPGDDTGR